MARGYPDFFGQSIFPKYGLPVHELKPVAVVAAGDTEIIFNVVGKGRTYGGWIRWYGTDDVFRTTKLIVTIDAVVQTFLTPYLELDRNISSRTAQTFALTGYEVDDLHENVVYTGEKDWTFEQTFVVTLVNDTAANITVVGSFDWSQVI